MDTFLQAGAYLVDPVYWVAVSIAIALAIVVGIVPGVGSLLVMALMIPFVLFKIEDPAIAIVMLATITGVNNTLDSIPAVLVGLPSGATQVTFLEGHQLARRGLGAYTLGAVYAVSAIGGVVGAVILALVIPVIKPFVLSFNYSEIAMMALFGVAMISALSRGAMVKGFAAAMLGILLGTVGIDPLSGASRFTFGQIQLWAGLPVIATVLGIFALPEMIDLSMTRQAVAPEGAQVSVREVFRGFRYGLSRWKVAIRQSTFGVFLGAVPGIGSAVVDWLAYAFGIFFTKDKSQFGKGSLDGVLFAESAQNSKEAGQAIPTLALGIPGGTGWIMIIVAMLAFGITPGTQMLGTYAHITMLIVITLALGNLIVTMLGLVFTAYLAKLTMIPYPVIGFCIIPIAFLAAFLDLTHWLAIPIVLVFTGIGLLMKRYQWPRPPLVLGFILGPIIDQNLQSALSIHGFVGVLTRPITITLFIVAVVVAFVMWRAMGRTEATVSQVTGGAEEPAAGDAHLQENTGLRLSWHGEHIVPIVGMLGAAGFLWASLQLPGRAQMLPMWLSIGILVLCFVQLWRQALTTKVRTVEILDLGMRSTGMAGMRSASLIVVGLLTAFVVLAMIVGLQYAAILLALLGPALLLSGRLRWIGGGLAAVVVAVFSFVLLDYLMAVIWPQPVIWTWVQTNLF